MSTATRRASSAWLRSTTATTIRRSPRSASRWGSELPGLEARQVVQPLSEGLRRAARAADPSAVDDHDSTEPARPSGAKVRQRWVGTATAPAAEPSPAPHYEPNR